MIGGSRHGPTLFVAVLLLARPVAAHGGGAPTGDRARMAGGLLVVGALFLVGSIYLDSRTTGNDTRVDVGIVVGTLALLAGLGLFWFH